VALAWLRYRAVPIIPIIGARKLNQLQDNVASLDLQLSSDQVKALDDASQIDLGFPYSMYAKDLVSNFRYGGMRNQIDAQIGQTPSRAPNSICVSPARAHFPIEIGSHSVTSTLQFFARLPLPIQEPLMTSRRVRLSFTLTTISLGIVALASHAQAPAGGPPKLSEQQFKNIKVLKG